MAEEAKKEPQEATAKVNGVEPMLILLRKSSHCQRRGSERACGFASRLLAISNVAAIRSIST